jgi:hypothetical protein
MPLAFPSTSHATVAFGFFNVEIDMLLLEHLFFFAEDFCRAVPELFREGEAWMDGWRIEARARIGNLQAAIAGQDLSGLIGATYRRFPFPQSSQDFKQNPEGGTNRPWVEDQVHQYGQAEQIRLRKEAGSVSVGEYRFDPSVFADLIAYVDRGGYPRWKNELRPSYVRKMMERVSPLLI